MDQPPVARASSPNQLDADGWMVRKQPWRRSELASRVKPNLELLIEYASSHYYTSSDGSPVVRRVMCVCDPPMRRCAPTQRRRACGCKLTWVSPSVARSLPACCCCSCACTCVRACMDADPSHPHHPSPCWWCRRPGARARGQRVRWLPQH